MHSYFTDPVNDRRPWTVRVVTKGERYGRGFCLVHDHDEPLVEFYDGRHGGQDTALPPERPTSYGAHLGQFVSRYTLDCLDGRNEWAGQRLGANDRGLCLDGGVPAWAISGALAAEVMEWLDRVVVRELAAEPLHQ